MSKNAKKSLFYDNFYKFVFFLINKYKEIAVENISKSIVALNTGKIVGYVVDIAVNFEDMKLLGYYIADNETEEEFLLKHEDIKCLGEDFLVVETASNLEYVLERKNNLLGKIFVSDTGVDLGRARKIVLNKTKCFKIETDKGEVLGRYITMVGQDCVVFSSKKSKRQTTKHVFDRPITNDDMVVQIQSHPQKIERVSLSTSFYVGKISGQDVFGYNNERIVSQGDKITKAIVEKAKLHNKLNQLFFAIKR